MMVLGVLAFVVALLASVMLHEAGHFMTARLFKMKATQFFVGFGPTLWSKVRGETEYGVKAIPAGGFVKIVGMTPLEEIPPEDQPRAFINKGGWQRFVVLVAGSTVHFVIALVLFFVFLVSWPSHDDHYAEVQKVFTCAAPDNNGDCAPGAVPAPAKGVLHAGDVIMAVNGVDVRHAQGVDGDTHKSVTGGVEAAIALIKKSSGTVHLTIKRDGGIQQLAIKPAVIDGAPRIGFSAEPHLTRVSAASAVPGAFNMFGETFVGSFKAMGAVPHEVAQVLSGAQQKRAVDGSGSDGGGAQVTSVVGVAQISGEAFKAGGLSGGLATLVLLASSVNLFVGIFNLFPFLPLDGGHVAILAYEKARDRWRRRRKLSALGPVDLAKLMPVTYGALAVIVGIAAIVLYADIANPVANPFQ